MAAAELGADLSRVVLAPSLGPDRRWQSVVATLLESVEFGLARRRPAGPAGRRPPVDGTRPVSAARSSSSSSRRRAALTVRRRRPGAVDLRCAVTSSTWEGLGQGHGRLQHRRADVEVGGQGVASRSRRGELEVAPAPR